MNGCLDKESALPRIQESILKSSSWFGFTLMKIMTTWMAEMAGSEDLLGWITIIPTWICFSRWVYALPTPKYPLVATIPWCMICMYRTNPSPTIIHQYILLWLHSFHHPIRMWTIYFEIQARTPCLGGIHLCQTSWDAAHGSNIKYQSAPIIQMSTLHLLLVCLYPIRILL